ncbi:MAG: UDP-3-O-(3-hydroxymyristoyl)glucosamine N-acyltransferase, partial [Acidobacteriota bacterium]|nr:UDP-3-O-(3-hydroxymyristoyl)glucosamine N-acyltransferase [Acidobacteriota bacterium]
MSYRLAELAERIGGRILGDPERVVSGVQALAAAGPDDLSFLTSSRYRAQAEASRAGALLVGPALLLPGRDLIV